MAIFGAIAGSKQDHVESSSSVELKGAGADELKYKNEQNAGYDALKKLFESSGTGEADFAASTAAQRSLADLLGSLSTQNLSENGKPTGEDISFGQSFANDIFKPRDTALQQSFTNQTTEANRLSAILGRSVDDPILQAKLRTGFMQQTDALNAEKGSFAAQAAYDQLGRRYTAQDRAVNFASNKSNVLSGLASQAFQNRAALLGLGNQLYNQEYTNRFNESTKHGENVSGGGFKGAVSGGLGGLSAVLDVVGAFYGKPPSGKDYNSGLKSSGASQSAGSQGYITQPNAYSGGAGGQGGYGSNYYSNIS